MYEAV